MGGIKFTKEGLKFCEEKVLKAYYNLETREEMIKIAKVLEIDLEKLKDSFLKETLGIKKPKRVKMIFIKRCGECMYRGIRQEDIRNGCFKDSEGLKGNIKPILDIDIIPNWCPLLDALGSE